MYNNGCCTPPVPIRNDCCCKDGIICALDWFFQDFLSVPSKIEPETLKYYPELMGISNIIYGIPYVSPDIVPIYIDEPTGESPTDPYCGDITYLNICEIEGFEFQLSTTLPTGVSQTTIESSITTRFSKIKYGSPNACCCKNGLMEYLLKARDFLNNPCVCGTGASTDVSVTISTSDRNYNITDILAINQDTVWAKETTLSDGETTTVYYVISLCKIIGLTFNRTNPASLEPQEPTPEANQSMQQDVKEEELLSEVEE